MNYCLYWIFLTHNILLKCKQTTVVNCGPKPDNATNCKVKHCLFNLKNDPCEYNDVSSQYPEIYQQMKNKLEDYKRRMVPSRKQPADKMADPRLHDDVWKPWRELSSNAHLIRFNLYILSLVLITIQRGQ